MIIEIEIKNWAKYNPRSDVKSCSWFRMSNDFFLDPDFYGCSLATRIIWIYTLSVASKKMSDTVRINTSMLSDSLKIPMSDIEKSIKELEKTGSITVISPLVISIRSDSIGQKMLTSATNKQTNKQTNIVEGFFEHENPDIEEINADQLAVNILTALNSICFSDHRPNKLNMGHINARIREKYTFDDFVSVIKHKQAQWGEDPKMSEFLRPKTLFSSSFDGYLQSARNALKPKIDPLDAFMAQYEQTFSAEA